MCNDSRDGYRLNVRRDGNGADPFRTETNRKCTGTFLHVHTYGAESCASSELRGGPGRGRGRGRGEKELGVFLSE